MYMYNTHVTTWMLLNDVMSCKARWYYISFTLKSTKVYAHCTHKNLKRKESHGYRLFTRPDAVWFHCFSEEYKSALKNGEKTYS